MNHQMKIQLSSSAFWDVDLQTLDTEKHSDFIIVRVFQYGLLNDLRAVLKFYPAGKIKKAFSAQRGIDKKAIALASVLGFVE